MRVERWNGVSEASETSRIAHREECCQEGEAQQLVLLYIQASEQAKAPLRRAVQRIRRNVRDSDTVLLLDLCCAVVLPQTALSGAQIVARRIYSLLVDVEFEIQILRDSAAQHLLQRLYSNQAMIVGKSSSWNEWLEASELVQGQNLIEPSVEDEDGLPYLAFLTSYPSHRLLHLFPYELACQYHCIPVGVERGVLTLATYRRLNQDIVLHLREITQRNIYQVRCEAGMIEDVLTYWQRVNMV